MEQTFMPFAHCKLDKVWNNFKRKGMNFMILCGNYAQSCKKYHDNLSGKQVRVFSVPSNFIKTKMNPLLGSS